MNNFSVTIIYIMFVRTRFVQTEKDSFFELTKILTASLMSLTLTTARRGDLSANTYIGLRS